MDNLTEGWESLMAAAAGGEVAGYLTRWKPAKGTPQAAAGFARAVVAASAPGTRDRAKCLLWASSKLASWAIPLGMEPVPQVLLHPSVTGRFAAHAPAISSAARRTLRTNLRFLARCVVPHLDPADEPLSRERAKEPYTRAEIAGYLALAGAQPTQARAMRATALVCLGAGAGLIRSDLRNARGTDIASRSGGVVVEVRGRAPRAVPVLSRYQPRLLEAAAYAGENFLTGGDKPERGNITNPLTRSLAGGDGLPPLDTSRLRAAWLAECAALIGLPAFMHAAGISCCQRLGDITTGLDPGGPHQLTYRQVEHTSRLIRKTLAKAEPDGAPPADLQRLCDQLLEASIPPSTSRPAARWPSTGPTWRPGRGRSRPAAPEPAPTPRPAGGTATSTARSSWARCSPGTTCPPRPW